jgi:hypothetical protein
MTYAANTKVSVTRSREQVIDFLRKHGAVEFAFGIRSGTSILTFALDDREIRITIDMPEREQECMSRWRAILLIVKAKLEAISSGISTIEREFLADVVVAADGRTVHEVMRDAINTHYQPKQIAGGRT